MALGRPYWSEARRTLVHLLSQETPRLRDDSALRSKALIQQVTCFGLRYPQDSEVGGEAVCRSVVMTGGDGIWRPCRQMLICTCQPASGTIQTSTFHESMPRIVARCCEAQTMLSIPTGAQLQAYHLHLSAGDDQASCLTPGSWQRNAWPMML